MDKWDFALLVARLQEDGLPCWQDTDFTVRISGCRLAPGCDFIAYNAVLGWHYLPAYGHLTALLGPLDYPALKDVVLALLDIRRADMPVVTSAVARLALSHIVHQRRFARAHPLYQFLDEGIRVQSVLLGNRA